MSSTHGPSPPAHWCWQATSCTRTRWSTWTSTSRWRTSSNHKDSQLLQFNQNFPLLPFQVIKNYLLVTSNARLDKWYLISHIIVDICISCFYGWNHTWILKRNIFQHVECEKRTCCKLEVSIYSIPECSAHYLNLSQHLKSCFLIVS